MTTTLTTWCTIALLISLSPTVKHGGRCNHLSQLQLVMVASLKVLDVPHRLSHMRKVTLDTAQSWTSSLCSPTVTPRSKIRQLTTIKSKVIRLTHSSTTNRFSQAHFSRTIIMRMHPTTTSCKMPTPAQIWCFLCAWMSLWVKQTGNELEHVVWLSIKTEPQQEIESHLTSKCQVAQ